MRVQAWDDEPYPNATALFQQRVHNAIFGRKGQELLREIEEALLAMPRKRLVSSVICESGDVCMLGALAVHRAVKAGGNRVAALAGLQLAAERWGQGNEDGWEDQDDETLTLLKNLLNIKQGSLAWTLVYENDECCVSSPEARYDRMLKWVQARIRRYYGYYRAPAPVEVSWRNDVV